MNYKGLVSSDWNECLAPTGPFDPIAFIYPEIKDELDAIFKNYTSNLIPLSEAVSEIVKLLPQPFSVAQMDAYLEECFAIYKGVVDMINMFATNDILFMINTTGAQGFFQRIMEKKLIPSVPFVAANPFVNFPGVETDPRFPFLVLETSDKGTNTEKVMKKFMIEPAKVVVIGDSGGDGAHFKWGASVGAFLIGSMAKISLKNFCVNNNIVLDKSFGVDYRENEARDVLREQTFDFRELGAFIVERLS